MTRVAIIADSHFDSSSRFDECQRIHHWIADDLEERGVDLILHSGDVFERKSNPEERSAVADWLRRAASIAPVVIVRGNHDALGDLALFAKLRTRHPVQVAEYPVVLLAAGVAVACLPWPRKAELLARAPELDPGDALRGVLRGLGQQLASHDGPRVLLAHAMVSGSRTSTGQPLVGCDFEIGVDDLALAGADLVALGHVHMPQDWPLEDAPVIYPGSPRRTAFGEVESKGYALAELEGQRTRTWRRIETPCAPMHLVEARWEGGCFLTRAVIDPAHAEVRFRYTVAADERDAARAAAELSRDLWLANGAVNVKLEEVVIATSSARAPEVALARTVDEKLRALWKARGEEPEAARAERLLSHVHDLEVASL